MTLELYVSQIMGIDKDDLYKDTRRRDIVNARQICMYIRYEFVGHTLSAVGRFFGKNHATVLHAVRTTENLRDTEPTYRDILDDVISAWYSGTLYVPAEHEMKIADIPTEEELLLMQLE